jgi:hypothetical protein
MRVPQYPRSGNQRRIRSEDKEFPRYPPVDRELHRCRGRTADEEPYGKDLRLAHRMVDSCCSTSCLRGDDLTQRTAAVVALHGTGGRHDNGEDELRAGSSVSFRVHQAPEVARLAPPFRIHCIYTDVELQRRLREVVTGDLTGVLETLFREDPIGEGTRVIFNWYVAGHQPSPQPLGLRRRARLPPQPRQRHE